jgi:hypothetical protein
MDHGEISVEQKPGKEITWAVGNVDFLVEQAH